VEKDGVQGTDRDRSGGAVFSEPAMASEPKKKCRMCGGRMDYYMAEKKWQCFSCAYEEPEKDTVLSKDRLNAGATIYGEAREERQNAERMEAPRTPDPGEQDRYSIFPDPAPVSESRQGPEKSEQKTTAEPTPGSELKQKCSMCGGQMDYYAAEAKWQCYSCGFEYFKKNEGQGKSEEKPSHSNVLLAVSPAESLFNDSATTRSSPGYWESKKKSFFSKKQPAMTKTCPACGKKMHSHGSDKGWQCRNCGYERRI
jgi:ribosomal protein L37AE/L43A